jgi:ABC-type sugar transport system ATPase subunit
MEGIRKIQAGRTSIVLITHNMSMAMPMSNRLIVMRRGENVGDVPTAALTADGIVALTTGARERWIGLRRDVTRALEGTVAP